MPYKAPAEPYYYFPVGYTEKMIDGQMYYHDYSMAPTTWKLLPSSIDRLLSHVQQFTGVKTRRVLLDMLSIDHATVSRCRTKGEAISPVWLVKLADFSGLTLDELRKIGGIQPLINRYNDVEK